MQKENTTNPYFIFLLPVFFVINGYNDYFGFFPLKFVFWNFVWVSVSVVVFYLTGKFLYKQNEKAVAFCFFISAFLIFFGSAFDTWKAITTIHFLTRYYFVIPFVLLTATLFTVFLKKYKNGFVRLFTYLNILFFVLILFEISRFTIYTIKTKPGDLLIDSRFNAFNSFKPAEQKNDTSKPDIFLLIFDAMPSSKALKQDIQFSNLELDTFLLKQGFFIAKEAKSNYEFTVLSVSSMLNMDYIPIEKIMNESGINIYFRTTSSIIDNSLVRILQKENYRIHQFQPLSIFTNKDWEGNRYFGYMLSMSYFYKTFPGRIVRDIGWNLLWSKSFENLTKYVYLKGATKRNDDLERTTKLIQTVCNEKCSPKFVYAHFILPHFPIVFTSAGSIRQFNFNDFINERKIEKSKFIDQHKFANTMILDLVKYIKEFNRKNTIIIVQGDHGYNSKSGNNDPEFVFQNLNAIYFPDRNYENLYPELSPVNSFRIILNKYFSSQYPLLKDSCVLYKFSNNIWEK